MVEVVHQLPVELHGAGGQRRAGEDVQGVDVGGHDHRRMTRQGDQDGCRCRLWRDVCAEGGVTSRAKKIAAKHKVSFQST